MIVPAPGESWYFFTRNCSCNFLIIRTIHYSGCLKGINAINGVKAVNAAAALNVFKAVKELQFFLDFLLNILEILAVCGSDIGENANCRFDYAL